MFDFTYGTNCVDSWHPNERIWFPRIKVSEALNYDMKDKFQRHTKGSSNQPLTYLHSIVGMRPRLHAQIWPAMCRRGGINNEVTLYIKCKKTSQRNRLGKNIQIIKALYNLACLTKSPWYYSWMFFAINIIGMSLTRLQLIFLWREAERNVLESNRFSPETFYTENVQSWSVVNPRFFEEPTVILTYHSTNTHVVYVPEWTQNKLCATTSQIH